MKKITYLAEECNAIPTALSKKDTAFTESILKENVSSRSGEVNQDKIHGFSKKVALTKNEKDEFLGDNAAIILRYLSAVTHKYGKKVEGKTWVRVNLDHISEQYPYMGRSTVDENVLRLQRFGCCEIKNAEGALKSRKNDRTRCYHIPKKWMDAAEEEPRYFSSAVACKVKVPAAVVYYNFCHWLGECKEQKRVEHVKLAPAILVDLLPYTKPTIKRAIRTLVSNEYIHPVLSEQCWYADGPDKSRGSKADESGSKADEPGSKADESGSKADNYIYCNKLTDVLEIDSKEKPAVSALECSSNETNKTNDLIISSNDGIITCADEQDRKEMTHELITASCANSSTSQDPSISTSSNVVSLQGVSTASGQNSNADFVFTQESVVPSTVSIYGGAGDVNGKWPAIESLRQLHMMNNIIGDEMAQLITSSSTHDKLQDTVLRICAYTMSKLDLSIMDELYDDPDADIILRAILPLFHRYLDEHPIEQGTTVFNIIYYGALECMVGAFLWPRDNQDSYTHPITSFIRITYKLYLVLWRRAEDLRIQTVDEEFAEMRVEFASVDAHKEDDSDLSPAERTRVFRNALNSRNKVGWICYDQQHRIDLIIHIKSPALKLVQRLFEHNPELTPKELLSIMDGCMEAYIKQPAPKPLERYVCHYSTESQKWHARMGHNLIFFVTNLHHVVRQLGMSTGCPVKVFLQDIKAQEEEEHELEMAA